jgi:hypothetical protein
MSNVNWDQPWAWNLGVIPFPTYGYWGGQGYSAGQFAGPNDTVDWKYPAADSLDQLFKDHDFAINYAQTPADTYAADSALVSGIQDLRKTGRP